MGIGRGRRGTTEQHQGPLRLPLGPLGTPLPPGDSGRRGLVVYPVVQGKALAGVRLARYPLGDDHLDQLRQADAILLVRRKPTRPLTNKQEYLLYYLHVRGCVDVTVWMCAIGVRAGMFAGTGTPVLPLLCGSGQKARCLVPAGPTQAEHSFHLIGSSQAVFFTK